MRIMGTETEYSVYAEQGRQSTIARHLSRKFVKLTPSALTMREGDRRFMGSGALFYIDAGDHPEFCTQEVWGPMAATIVEESGIRLMGGAIQKLRDLGGLSDEEMAIIGYDSREIQEENRQYLGDKEYLLRNVAGRYTAWGHHINLLTSRAVEVDKYTLSPLLLTMLGGIALFGAGRFPQHGGFQRFQKGSFIHALVHGSTETTKPLINTRDEPLADPEKYKRLHIVGNDALFSPWAKWLRFSSYDMALAISEKSPATVRKLEGYLPKGGSTRGVRAFSGGNPNTTTFETENDKQVTAVDCLEMISEELHGLIDEGIIPADDEYRERRLGLAELDEAVDMLKDKPHMLEGLVDSSTRDLLHKQITDSGKVKSQAQQHGYDVLLDDAEGRNPLAARYQAMATEASKKRLCNVYEISVEKFDELCDKHMVDPYAGRSTRRAAALADNAEWMGWEMWKKEGGDPWHKDLNPEEGAKEFPFWEEAA